MVVPAACPVHDAGAATVAAGAVAGEAAASGEAPAAALLAGEAAGEALALGDGLAEDAATAVTAIGATEGTALLVVTGLGAAPVTAGALVPAAPEVADADALSVTFRVF
jgi:hypothetical protein